MGIAMAEPMYSQTLPQQNFSPLAGLLSYLVPGLGQIVQGRIGKGLLFFVCLYGLFFYGQYLGNWRNVYVTDGTAEQKQQQQGRGRVLEMVADKARFFAQFWIGAAAWPALVQYHAALPPQDPHPMLGFYQRPLPEDDLKIELRNSDKSPDLGWMYTVIAGVLNILVIYDALAGPAHGPIFRSAGSPTPSGTKEAAIA
jgi:hypothetical protein